jgi:spore maturation protein CgeB
MRVLYVAPIKYGNTAQHRYLSLLRLGHDVEMIDSDKFIATNAMVQKFEFRSQIGPNVSSFNTHILDRASAFRPDIVWFDKALALRPATVRGLQRWGIRTVSYMIDNMFGPRVDPGWRLYRQCIPLHDLHVTQRDCNIAQYRAVGARDVVKIQTAFEPTVHYPPSPDWSDADRDRQASFIGNPYDDRADRLTEVAMFYRQPIDISGNRGAWATKLAPEMMRRFFRSHELLGAAYREGIWRSRVNIAFVTRSNEDEFAHKAFEIAGCSGFLLAEDVPGHRERFIADEEAVFFTDNADLATKIARYLPDEAARRRIAAAGHARAVASGYDNDTQVAHILRVLTSRDRGSPRAG